MLEGERGNFRSSEDWLLVAIERAEATELTHFGAPYSNWGKYLVSQSQHESAISKYKQALEVDPNYAIAYNNWGKSLQHLERYEEAIEKYEAAIRIDPDYASPYNGWGSSLHYLGRYEEAIEKYEAAIRIDPDIGAAYTNWFLALAELLGTEGAAKCAKHLTLVDAFRAAAERSGHRELLDRFNDLRCEDGELAQVPPN